MKKKTFKSLIIEYGKYPAIIVGCFIALGIMYRYGYKVLTIPERVEAAEEKIEDVQDYIKEQRIANDLMKDMFQQQQQYQRQPTPCQWYEGIFYCFDKKSQTWYEVKTGG